VTEAFQAWARRSGLTIPFQGPHCLRHSYAVHLLRQGVPLKTIGCERHRPIVLCEYAYARACNGLVLPDRTPEPELYEVQKVYQRIDTLAVDAAAGRLRVRNDYDFQGLDFVEVAWDVTEDGRIVRGGRLKAPDRSRRASWSSRCQGPRRSRVPSRS
jgi:beta-galactosidase/beta-glucuronidase